MKHRSRSTAEETYLFSSGTESVLVLPHSSQPSNSAKQPESAKISTRIKRTKYSQQDRHTFNTYEPHKVGQSPSAWPYLWLASSRGLTPSLSYESALPALGTNQFLEPAFCLFFCQVPHYSQASIHYSGI